MAMNSKDEVGFAATEAAKLPLSRLGAYLAIGVGTGALATSAEAAVVPIPVGPSGFNITGVNGGVTAGTFTTISNFPTTNAGSLYLTNAFGGSETGVYVGSGFLLATGGSNITVDPFNFAAGALIDANAGGGEFRSGLGTLFKYGTLVSPDFLPNSFLGFKDALGRYGYIETTWNSTTNEFQIFSAAYESTPGVAIRAGDPGPSAVPEIDPTGLASTMSLVMGSVAMLEQRRRKRAALAAESTAVTA